MAEQYLPTPRSIQDDRGEDITPGYRGSESEAYPSRETMYVEGTEPEFESSPYPGQAGSPAERSDWSRRLFSQELHYAYPPPLSHGYSEYGWEGPMLVSGQTQPYPFSSPASQQHYIASPTPTASEVGVYTEPGTLPRARLVADRKPRAKKAKRKDRVGVEETVLTQPLSIITRESKIALKDVERFVSRGAEERLIEVQKKGYIPRPMNSFILYRNVYQDRIKEFAQRNNHQDVSKIGGASWKLESGDFRAQYKRWADIEKDNHKEAFPDYKFSPANSKTATKKRKGGLDYEGQSDLGDSGSEWGPEGQNNQRQKHFRRTPQPAQRRGMLSMDLHQRAYAAPQLEHGQDAFEHQDQRYPEYLASSSARSGDPYYQQPLHQYAFEDFEARDLGFMESDLLIAQGLMENSHLSGVPGHTDTLLTNPQTVNQIDGHLLDPSLLDDHGSAFTQDQFDSAFFGTSSDPSRQVHNADLEAPARGHTRGQVNGRVRDYRTR